MYDFPVDCNIIGVSDILGILNHLMKKMLYTILFKFIKQTFISSKIFSGSLARVAKVCVRAKYISPNNKPCLARPALIGLILNGLM